MISHEAFDKQITNQPIKSKIFGLTQILVSI